MKRASETVATTPRAAAYTSPPSALLDAVAMLMAAGSGTGTFVVSSWSCFALTIIFCLILV